MSQRAHGKGPQIGRGFGNAASRFAPHEKARDQRGTLRRVVALYRDQKALLAAVAVLTVASAALHVMIPYWTGRAFNAFAGTGWTGTSLGNALRP